MIDAAAEQLRESLPGEVARARGRRPRHGRLPAGQRVDVDDHPELRDGVVLLGGEARFRHLYCRAGADRRRRRDLARRCWADRAEVLTRDEAIALGWFGDVEPRTPAARRRRRRLPGGLLGDEHLGLPLRDQAGRPARLADPAEMLIPVIVA